ncbi:hypothetical protein F4677DRAFT_460328 [Hypoxylon crocopeplum]|nr:hypothetical protein F4677DRAFT_460328 [Hypoxylon crocopeplum]
MSSSLGSVTPADELGARIIYELPLHNVRGTSSTVDISPLAQEGCIRMIDCVAFADHDTLRIWEFPRPPLQEFKNFLSWPKLKYSAISYVWRGNPAGPCAGTADGHPGYLTVREAEDADPISIDVLRCACIASLGDDEVGRWRMISRAEYIWLDRLCIIQTSKRDKSLQISQMYALYRCCTQCLVLPGGLNRLVPLDEATAWANRAWTLQECLAPHYPIVLFYWSRGTGRCIGTSAFKLREVGHGTGSALARFIDVLRACIDKPMVFNACPIDSPLSKWNTPSIIAQGVAINIQVFGKGHADLFALRQARLSFQNSSESLLPSSTRRCNSMIWRCALIRTSSSPVDMVLSIMGLMGVELNPRDFEAGDRLGATIALASTIMNQGGSADWLGMPANIPPCPQLSTFPQFAQTEVSGHARYVISGELRIGRTLYDWAFAGSSWESPGRPELWPWERLRGSMDEDGYLAFTRKACVVFPVIGESQSNQISEWPEMQSTDGSIWLFKESLNLNLVMGQRTAVVPLWQFREEVKLNEYEMADMSMANPMIKLMLLREHAPGMFHLVSYFYLRDLDIQTWRSRIEAWKEYDFKVGGPHITR